MSPRHRIAVEALALGLVAAVAVTIHAWIAAVDMGIIGFSDAVDYLYLTDFYRGHFLGQVDSHAADYYRVSRLPPLYPVVLAALGAGTHALHWSQIVASCLTVAMLVPMWWWLRRESGSAAIGVTLAMLVVISPGLFLVSLKPASEPVAMAMTWIAFLIASKPNQSPTEYVALAVLVGISALVRSANIALAIALPVWLWTRRLDLGRRLAVSALALLPFVLWTLYRRTFAGAESYLAAMTPANIVSALGGWPNFLYLHPWTLFLGLVRNLDHTPGPASIAAVAILLAFALAGGWTRLCSGKLDAIFVCTYAAMLLVWPYPAEAPRFMTFILPIVLLYSTSGARRLVETLEAEQRATGLACAVAVALALVASAPTMLHFVKLASVRVDDDLQPEQREQLYFLSPDRATAIANADAAARVRLAAAEAARRIPAGACVYSTLPHLFALRAPVRTLRYPLRLSPDASADAQLATCNYFFVTAFSGNVPGEGAFHLADALRGWTQPILVSRVELGKGPYTLAALLVRTEAIREATEATPPEFQ